MRACRLAVVSSHPIQHFAPLYRELASKQDIELKVFYLAENGVTEFRDQQFSEDFKWDIPLLENYHSEFLEPGRIIHKFGFFSMDSKKLVPALSDYEPDVIWLHGYAQMANLRVLLSPLRSKTIIYSSDSNLADTRSWWRSMLKRWYVKFFFGRCDYFLSISPSNREYLRYFGVAEQTIVDTHFPVDITRLTQDRDRLASDSKQTLRNDLQLPEDSKIVLFAGKLIEHKGPQDLLSALTLMEQEVYALFVGNGELMPQLKERAQQSDAGDRVRFTGFINQRELAAYFDLADIFVFPSRKEPYGAVAAEVLPFALPMVVADCVGAIGSSVLPQQNALLFRTGDVQHLAQQLDALVQNDQMRAGFSQASAKLAADHDKSVMARDIIKICSKFT